MKRPHRAPAGNLINRIIGYLKNHLLTLSAILVPFCYLLLLLLYPQK